MTRRDDQIGLAAFWSKHFLICEFLASAGLAAALCVGIELTGLSDGLRTRLNGNRGQIYGVAVGAFVSGFGFLMAVATLVAQSLSLPRFDRFRKLKVYPQLWATYWSAFLWLGSGTVVAAIALVLDRDGNQAVPPLMYATFFLSVLSLARVARCVWILSHVVKVVVPPLAQMATSGPRESAEPEAEPAAVER